MKTVQYQLKNKKTGKVEGWLVGKTPNRELVFDIGGATVILPINAAMERKYEIVKVECSTK